MNVLDLFSGIGGFSLGLERAGMRTVAFCEIEPFPRAVLAQHWPHVPCYDDVRTLTAGRLAADGIARIDVICGGFPCQDLSVAGRGAGLAGERSGLWFEYARLIRELRPRYVIVENVAALLGRGLDVVLGDLASLGFDAEWDCITAESLGAPHERDRLWIVAYARDAEWRPQHSARQRVARSERLSQRQEGSGGLEPASEKMADTGSDGLRTDNGPIQNPSATRQAQGAGDQWEWVRTISGRSSKALSHAHRSGREQQWWAVAIRAELAAAQRSGWWSSEPAVGRVAHGVPRRVDRLRGLGNAVVPQIPEIIGRAILQAEGIVA